jgi:hypothetical protein
MLVITIFFFTTGLDVGFEVGCDLVGATCLTSAFFSCVGFVFVGFESEGEFGATTPKIIKNNKVKPVKINEVFFLPRFLLKSLVKAAGLIMPTNMLIKEARVKISKINAKNIIIVSPILSQSFY